jgi:hypothetical protein
MAKAARFCGPHAVLPACCDQEYPRRSLKLLMPEEEAIEFALLRGLAREDGDVI